MNQDAIEFFERIGIDKDGLSTLDGTYIYEAQQVNSLVAKNCFHDKMQNLTKKLILKHYLFYLIQLFQQKVSLILIIN